MYFCKTVSSITVSSVAILYNHSSHPPSSLLSCSSLLPSSSSRFILSLIFTPLGPRAWTWTSLRTSKLYGLVVLVVPHPVSNFFSVYRLLQILILFFQRLVCPLPFLCFPQLRLSFSQICFRFTQRTSSYLRFGEPDPPLRINA
jgi:hypothetical protein